MKVKGLFIGAALLALLGGCATYDDGYANYRDGRYPYYRNDGYRSDGSYRRWDGDRFYYRSSPEYSRGFSYNQH